MCMLFFIVYAALFDVVQTADGFVKLVRHFLGSNMELVIFSRIFFPLLCFLYEALHYMDW
jgi:hypothetical protein